MTGLGQHDDQPTGGLGTEQTLAGQLLHRGLPQRHGGGGAVAGQVMAHPCQQRPYRTG